jgi:hypothetical protein
MNLEELRGRVGAILGGCSSRCLDDDNDFAAVRETIMEWLCGEEFQAPIRSCRLILAIEANPEQNPTETVKLAPKTREQLQAAVRGAEYLLSGNR